MRPDFWDYDLNNPANEPEQPEWNQCDECCGEFMESDLIVYRDGLYCHDCLCEIKPAVSEPRLPINSLDIIF